MNPSTTVPTNFWEDANLFPDQDKAKSLVNVFKQNTGGVNQDSFSQVYGSGQDLNSITKSLQSSAEGMAWLNPSSSQAESQLNQMQMKNPIDVYNEMTEKLGIGDVRTRVTNMRREIANTEQLLAGVGESVAGRTAGSLVTNAQRSALINQERNPINELLSTQGRNYNTESQNLADLMGQANTMTGYEVTGQNTQRQTLLDRLTNARSREAQEAEARRVLEEQRRWEEESKRWWEDFNTRKANDDRAFALQRSQFDEAKRQAQVNLAALTRQANPPAAAGNTSGGNFYLDQATQNVSKQLQGTTAQIKSDYERTKQSAAYGNQMDKYKLELYHKLRPDLFGGAVNVNALANGGQLRF